jgi:hypothetical protein
MGILERHEDKWCPEPNSGCYLWFGSCAGGANNDYPIALYRGKVVQVTRIVCEETYGPPPTVKHEAAHNCNFTKCVNPDHLNWSSRSNNEYDKYKRNPNPNWGTYKRNGYVVAKIDNTYLGQFNTQEEANRARDLYRS